jgi:hypothetical protein
MKIHSRHLRTHLFIWMILVSFVLSCVPAVKNPLQPAATIGFSATLPVIQDTSTPLKPVKSISTRTAPQIVELSLEQDCIPIEENIPEDLTLSGVLVRGQFKPYLENLDEHTKYEVPLKGGSIFSLYRPDFAISPDGKHLAYIDSYLDDNFHMEKRILRVIKSSGHSLLMDYWPADWQWIIGWADNQTLALSIGDQGLILLNPFTGHWTKFRPEWLTDDFGWFTPYVPPLGWLLDDSASPHMALKDVNTEKIIWQTDHRGSLNWSRDGSRVVVDTADLIHVISKDGQAMEFDISKLNLEFWDVIVSPNGQKLAFETFSSEQFYLDLKKAKIDGLCADVYKPSLRYGSTPFWSPDNRFLVLSVYDSTSYLTYDNKFDILIDTEQRHAYKLPTKSYQYRLAWLATP